MLAGEQSRAVPYLTVGLIRQHIRQCLVHTPAVPHARALRDRRANERMTEAEHLQIDIDDACPGSWRSHVEIQGFPGDDASRPEDLTDRVSVVERGHQYHEPSLFGQLGDTGGECALKTLGQRQRT